MKTIIFAATLLFMAMPGFAQKNRIVGAWYWSDSTNKISIIFKPDGKILLRSGPIAQKLRDNERKEGIYTFTNNKLTITWSDGAVHKPVIKFIYKDSFRMTIADNQNKSQKRELIFNQLKDEEVKGG